jgi:16S rRNA processing protein RimM
MELIAIGTVRTAWGVKGWLKLKSHSGEWSHFSDLESVSLKAVNRNHVREYRIEGFRLQQGGGLMKLAGIDSPEMGKTLAGYEILVSKDHASPLQEDEWYLDDLIGISLIDEEGKILGQISGLIEAADDLLEISKPDGKRFLVPFRSRFVGEPDIDKGTLVLTALWLMDES